MTKKKSSAPAAPATETPKRPRGRRTMRPEPAPTAPPAPKSEVGAAIETVLAAATSAEGPAGTALETSSGKALFFAMKTGRVKIEWSSELESWQAKLEGSKAQVFGDSPCRAGVLLFEMVTELFTALEAYGLPLTKLLTTPPLAIVLQAFKRDIERAHQEAHEAEQAINDAKESNSLN